MITHHRKLCFLSLFLLAGFAAPALGAENFTAAQREEIQSVIREYLSENPELVIEAIESYRGKMEAKMEQEATANIGKHNAFLTEADAPAAGNPKGDVTVVEFFDYNCGYCKQAYRDINNILKEDKNVRFVFHEMPILGPTSLTASRWALAAHKQGKYFEYHAALMGHNGNKSDAELEKLAKTVGLDTEKMKKDANSEEVKAMIEKSLAVSRDLGVQGTPAFVVEGKMIRGYVGEEGMKNAIKIAREAE